MRRSTTDRLSDVFRCEQTTSLVCGRHCKTLFDISLEIVTSLRLQFPTFLVMAITSQVEVTVDANGEPVVEYGNDERSPEERHTDTSGAASPTKSVSQRRALLLEEMSLARVALTTLIVSGLVMS